MYGVLGVAGMEGRPKLGELLVAARAIDEAALENALAKQKASGGRLGQILLAMGALDEEMLVRTVARQLSMPVAWLRGKRVKPEILSQLPGHVAHKHRCLPVLVDRRDTETLLVAMEDPSDTAALDEIAVAAGKPVRVVLAAPSELDEALARHYPEEAEPELLLEDPLAGDTDSQPELRQVVATDAPRVDSDALGFGDDLEVGEPGDSSAALEVDVVREDPLGLEEGASETDREADSQADTNERLGDSLDAAIDDGLDLGDSAERITEPHLDATPPFVASEPGDARAPGAGDAADALPRDPELRALALLLIERGLVSREELAERLHAAREAQTSES